MSKDNRVKFEFKGRVEISEAFYELGRSMADNARILGMMFKKDYELSEDDVEFRNRWRHEAMFKKNRRLGLAHVRQEADRVRKELGLK